MSFQRDPAERADFSMPPNQPPREGWSPGRFSPAILLVAVIVIAILIGAAVLSRRNARGTATPTVVAGQPVAGASTVASAAASAPASAAVSSAASAPSSTAPSASAAAGSAAAPTATVAPRVFVVGNTDGEGVYLRRSPRMSDKDTAYIDGTKLTVIGEDVTAEGELWHHVRAPDGKVGYVPAKYTVEAPR